MTAESATLHIAVLDDVVDTTTLLASPRQEGGCGASDVRVPESTVRP